MGRENSLLHLLTHSFSCRTAGQALEAGYNVLLPKFRELGKNGMFRAWLFTDGEHNVEPRNPAGFRESLRDYQRETDGFLPQTDVFGFGPKVLVDVLETDVARTTGGLYGSVYSPSEVATNFVNAAAAWVTADEPPVELSALDEAWRIKMVDVLRSLATTGRRDLNKAQEVVRNTAREMDNAGGSPAMGADLWGENGKQGQVELAVSCHEYFGKWGHDFLLSLASAYALKRCAQFRSPGLQLFATPRFKTAQARINAVFMGFMRATDALLDAREAERVRNSEQARLAAIASRASYVPAVYVPTARVSGSALLDPQGGCIDGECTAEAADGSIVKVRDIKVGDWMRPAVGEAAVCVTHVVRTRPAPTTPAVRFHCGLTLTAFHPVKVADTWAFPQTVEADIACKGTAATVGLGHMYSFGVKASFKARSECFGLLINGIAVATLGHEVQHDAVLKHGFWGTALVLQRIEAMNAWAARSGVSPQDNVVNLNGWCWTCDARTGLSNGLSSLQNDALD